MSVFSKIRLDRLKPQHLRQAAMALEAAYLRIARQGKVLVLRKSQRTAQEGFIHQGKTVAKQIKAWSTSNVKESKNTNLRFISDEHLVFTFRVYAYKQQQDKSNTLSLRLIIRVVAIRAPSRRWRPRSSAP